MKLALLVAILLAGCATNINGVLITDEEREACAALQDCTVWSKEQLQGLATHFYRAGLVQGSKAL